MDWKSLQINANQILMQGVLKLKNNSLKNWNDVDFQNYGNYIICENEIQWYIGEGKNISKRLKQQFKERTSTFYKTYRKDFGNKDINSFQVKFIETNIGRKEIEEFGIVNLPTSLNKFQKNKCKKLELKHNSEFNWDLIQSISNQLLLEGEELFFKQNFQNWFEAGVPVNAGIYMVFNEINQIIYIGETSSLLERYKTHSGKTYFSALRRHIGHRLLNFEFVQIKSKRKNREFLEDNDLEITNFLKKCKIKFLTVNIGRYELEEYLIRKHHPILNKKENKKNNI
jgi:predicted GIY-YIG superfamily endonuclease